MPKSGRDCARARRDVGLWAVAVSLLGLAAIVPATVGATTDRGQKNLPPGATHGPAALMHEYPTLSLASPAQRAAAARLWAQAKQAAAGWSDPKQAAADGYHVKLAKRRKGDLSVHWLHAERPGYGADDGVRFDPSRPKAAIYANAPNRPLVLVGVMYSLRRGVRGPTPGGPITRWHTHLVCMQGVERGVTPLPDGSCPPRSKKRQGSEMMHIWFTRDLRSGFGIHAPELELCMAGLLPPTCHLTVHQHPHG